MGRTEVFLSAVSITYWLVFILTCVEGQYHVIGSPEPIRASPGDDVILPVQVEPELNVETLTVEWSNPDLKPDPRDRLQRVEYVHLYRDSEEDPDMQMASYRGRTALFLDQLQHGNVSLKIINVSEKDGGRYRCFIPKLKGRTQSSIVTLIIGTNTDKIGTTETPMDPRVHTDGPKKDLDGLDGLSPRCRLIPVVVLLVLLVLCAGSGLYVFMSKYKNHKSLKSLQSKCLDLEGGSDVS